MRANDGAMTSALQLRDKRIGRKTGIARANFGPPPNSPLHHRARKAKRPPSGPIAQLDRASDYESEGRAFESLWVRQRSFRCQFTKCRASGGLCWFANGAAEVFSKLSIAAVAMAAFVGNWRARLGIALCKVCRVIDTIGGSVALALANRVTAFPPNIIGMQLRLFFQWRHFFKYFLVNSCRTHVRPPRLLQTARAGTTAQLKLSSEWAVRARRARFSAVPRPNPQTASIRPRAACLRPALDWPVSNPVQDGRHPAALPFAVRQRDLKTYQSQCE